MGQPLSRHVRESFRDDDGFYVTKQIFVFYYKVISHDLFYVKNHSRLFYSLKECFMV